MLRVGRCHRAAWSWWSPSTHTYSDVALIFFIFLVLMVHWVFPESRKPLKPVLGAKEQLHLSLFLVKQTLCFNCSRFSKEGSVFPDYYVAHTLIMTFHLGLDMFPTSFKMTRLFSHFIWLSNTFAIQPCDL